MNNNIKYLNPQNKPKTAAGVGCTRLELWLVDLPKPDNDTHVQYGVRPAIVISNDAANENSTYGVSSDLQPQKGAAADARFHFASRSFLQQHCPL